ncbi:MAG: hypothetical protein A3I68_00625 [Candidatus Melainabacteria bacterium RIFCSPLOWO2_02_FULL_35_15]|nr:MAG: hypothetical protein A3I68_00625 [Candidatus Melainabacteria bacterium RIFCSPLOWO2_02_FULL_35_15]
MKKRTKLQRKLLVTLLSILCFSNIFNIFTISAYAKERHKHSHERVLNKRFSKIIKNVLHRESFTNVTQIPLPIDAIDLLRKQSNFY